MFRRLKNKWHLNWVQFTLVFMTFALGGSLCGYLGKKILGLTGIEKDGWYYLLYVVLITLLWPLSVITVSVFTGQFPFFRSYLSKMKNRLVVGRKPASSQRIAIFASGAGTNAANIIAYFINHPTIQVALIVCNKPGAGVLQIAADAGIPTLLIKQTPFAKEHAYLDELSKYKISFIVLAGFLWKIPSKLIQAFPNRIINIHPALLPKYGGRGMYGMKVHETVIAAGEKESGITIHYVNEHYDAGAIIFQKECTLADMDTPESLATRVHQLEYTYYPQTIEKVLSTSPDK